MNEHKKLEYDDVEIRGRMDIEDIVRLQINRCNASAYEPDQTLFESNVMILLDLLPHHKRQQVIEREEEYLEQKEVPIYEKYWLGRPVHSSKKTVKMNFLDFHDLYRIILDAYAERGLTWQIEPELVDKGKVPEREKPIPTPIFKSDEHDQ